MGAVGFRSTGERIVILMMGQTEARLLPPQDRLIAGVFGQ
jgi:hypothetical protein